jgi:hypothetical protein
VLIALALLLPFSAQPETPAALAAEVRGGAAIAQPLLAVDGPGHHFGYTSSVLAQTTPQLTQTVVAAQQTQQAAPPPASTGSGQCAVAVGLTCTIAGNVNGAWTKTNSGSFTFTAVASATVIANDGFPILFMPTTAGVEQFNFTCTAPTGPGASVTCAGTTVGDLLQGATVTVRFVTTGGFQDVTGTVDLAAAGASRST